MTTSTAYAVKHLALPDSADLAERFWTKVQIGAADQCWPWSKGFFPDGYGQFWIDGRGHGAHRVAWCLANTACLMPSVLIRHDCDNPPCCNPAHLQPGTAADNSDDMVVRGRSLRGDRHPKRIDPSRVKRGQESPAWRERCRRNHDPAFRYLTSKGVRRCRLCDRITRSQHA